MHTKTQTIQAKRRRLLQPLFVTLIFFSLATSSAFGQSVQLRVLDASGEPLPDVVMELLADSLPVRAAVAEAQIDQLDKEFVPSITTVVAGSRISFPNSDDILHHVYSFSTAKTFDTPLYGSDANNQYSELFDVPGVVEIGCNIHDWMLAYIYIGESDWMAITDEQGVATLQGIPAGEYRLRVWHARLDAPDNSLEQDLVIAVGQDQQLEMSVDLVRDRRVRRAPSANRKRYR